MRIVKSLTVALAAFALLAGNASAAQQNFPPAKFSTDEAAYCTATFGWVLQFLAPQGMSQEAVVQTNIAFMMWNYEMQVSAPTADDATMQAAADSAVTKLTANFPQEQSEANAKAIVDQVTAAANDCGKKIEGKNTVSTAHLYFVLPSLAMVIMLLFSRLHYTKTAF